MGNNSSSSPPGKATGNSQKPAAAIQNLIPPGYDGSAESRAALNTIIIREIHQLEAENRELLEAIQVKRANLRDLRDRCTQNIADTDKAVCFGLEKAETETKEHYFQELQQLKRRKQQDLADTVAELQAVAFPERKLFMIEDVRALVLRDFDTTWQRVQRQIVEEGNHKLQHALRISQEEHNQILGERKETFGEELQKLQAQVAEHKASRGGGIFSWFSPSSRKKPRDDSDSDIDHDDDDDDDEGEEESTHRQAKRSKR
jgi:hypothetical protein